eukprot:CAMPEP_0174830886 /NCGR_PEP_ID=MMETSP1114-20130205/2780_1 /TAXON_ID=312471 /ORGANISM="Neobodo designis, Strain CCAP 1951/1" /LENGTH=442 /DNA_ID=CAMNT_0016064695 /DNA_START=110 /DNA_END=1438 /DNA_ORIENTATION=-
MPASPKKKSSAAEAANEDAAPAAEPVPVNDDNGDDDDGTDDRTWDFPELEDGGKKGGARRRKIKEAAKKVGEKGKEKSSRAAEAFSSALSTKVGKIAERTSKASHRVTERLLDKDRPSLEVVLLHDKISYTVSVVSIVSMAFTIGYAPFWYIPWNTVMAFLLLSRRWWQFRKENQHYYLYDFCYWANLLTVIYSWFLPRSTTLFHIIFMVAVGPLGWSIPTFTNSMIFHSAAHMTSVFIHLSPGVLTYAVRWHVPQRYGYKVCDDYPGCWETSPWTLLRDSYLIFYLPWAVFYFVWVYILMERRIKERGYEILFAWIIEQKPMAFVRRMTSNVMMQKVIYSAVHAVFALGTMFVGLAAWYSHAVHLTLVMFWVGYASWNASGYYFSVFAKRYVDELQRRAMSHEESHAALAAHLHATHASGDANVGNEEASVTSTTTASDTN